MLSPFQDTPIAKSKKWDVGVAPPSKSTYAKNWHASRLECPHKCHDNSILSTSRGGAYHDVTPAIMNFNATTTTPAAPGTSFGRGVFSQLPFSPLPYRASRPIAENHKGSRVATHSFNPDFLAIPPCFDPCICYIIETHVHFPGILLSVGRVGKEPRSSGFT